MEGKYTILIVDDNVDLADSLRDVLETEGYDVAIAHNGQDTLAICRQENFDLALIDIKLPDTSGTELIEELARLYSDMEYIIITGHASLDSAINAAKKKNVVSYETKPLDMDRFLALIRQVFVRKQTEMALRRTEQNFRNSLDESPLGIRIVSADGELFYANKAILDIYGYSNIEELRDTPSKQRYTPESYDEHLARKEKGKRGDLVQDSYESSIVRQDGEIRYLLVSRKEVVWDGETQYQVLYRDITESKKIEKELEDTFNLSPDMLGVLTTDGALLKVNPAWEIILGYKPKELYEMGWTQLVHPDDVKKTTAEVAKQLEGSSVVSFINRYKCKDGSYKTLEWQATFAAEGIVHATARDITERKQAEEALKASEARYQDLYENAPDMYVSVDPNTAEILRCNQTLAANLGYTKGEIVGRPIFDMYHPDCMDDVKREFQSFVETGEIDNAELQLKRKDGTKIDVSLNVSAEYDDQGNIIYSRSAWRDITETKKAEEEIKQAANSPGRPSPDS